MHAPQDQKRVPRRADSTSHASRIRLDEQLLYHSGERRHAQCGDKCIAHAALGAEIIHQHPAANGAATRRP